MDFTGDIFGRVSLVYRIPRRRIIFLNAARGDLCNKEASIIQPGPR